MVTIPCLRIQTVASCSQSITVCLFYRSDITAICLQLLVSIIFSVVGPVWGALKGLAYPLT